MSSKNQEKSCTEMNFNEFWEWSTSYLIDGLIVGGFKELRSRMHVVLQQTSWNKEFGGGKTTTPSPESYSPKTPASIRRK